VTSIDKARTDVQEAIRELLAISHRRARRTGTPGARYSTRRAPSARRRGSGASPARFAGARGQEDGTLQLSEDAMRRVREVLGIVLVPNAVAIAAGAIGLINPVMAAAVNNGSTIVAALHAVSPLLRVSGKRSPP
jgi:hypothetical protein